MVCSTYNKYIKNKSICVDCGGKINKYSIRCRSCNTKYKWTSGLLSSLRWPTGKDSYHWKGGRHKDNRGYLKVLQHNHPRCDKCGYVLEHIIVWEKANGKSLPNSWVIHHLNGIPDDNRPVNLQALPSKKHRFILEAKAKRIQALEALLNKQQQLL